jgi:uncharacterized protein
MWTKALVTGASAGIGTAFVNRLASEGVALVVVARRRDRLDELAAKHHNVEVLPADLSTEAGVELVADRLSTGDIDLLVNNAGFGNNGAFHTVPVKQAMDEVLVNVVALTRLAHAATQVMVPKRHGGILNVSSIASFQASPGFGSYGATKAFVTSFSETLHEDLRKHGVKVTALCPGLTRTEFHEVAGMDGYDNYPSFIWQTADEVAKFGLNALAKGTCIAIPGAPNKVLAGASNLLPRFVTRKAAGLSDRNKK